MADLKHLAPKAVSPLPAQSKPLRSKFRAAEAVRLLTPQLRTFTEKRIRATSGRHMMSMEVKCLRAETGFRNPRRAGAN